MVNKHLISLEIIQMGSSFHLLIYKKGERIAHYVAHGADRCEKLKNELEAKIKRGDFTHYKTQREKVSQYVQENHFYSVMNCTKWEELRKSMDELRFSPAFAIKYLLDAEQNTEVFQEVPSCFGDWSCEHFPDSFLIEWLKIHSKFRDFQGKLIPDKITDFTDIIQSILEKYQIPHEKEKDIFTIYGYKRSRCKELIFG